MGCQLWYKARPDGMAVGVNFNDSHLPTHWLGCLLD